MNPDPFNLTAQLASFLPSAAGTVVAAVLLAFIVPAWIKLRREARVDDVQVKVERVSRRWAE